MPVRRDITKKSRAVAADPETWGEEPQLVWVEIDKLTVDERYQRTMDSERPQRLINNIVRNFRWAAFGALVATWVGKGDKLALIDGQHRWRAAVHIGIKKVPVVIVGRLSVEAQAEAFVHANQQRSPVHSLTLHHASLLAGDAKALKIQALLDEVKLSVPRNPTQAKYLKPGQFLAIGSVSMLMSSYRPDVVKCTLKIIAHAFYTSPGRIVNGIIRAVAVIISERGTGVERSIIDALVGTPVDEFSKIVLNKLRAGYKGTDATVEALVSILDCAGKRRIA